MLMAAGHCRSRGICTARIAEANWAAQGCLARPRDPLGYRSTRLMLAVSALLSTESSGWATATFQNRAVRTSQAAHNGGSPTSASTAVSCRVVGPAGQGLLGRGLPRGQLRWCLTPKPLAACTVHLIELVQLCSVWNMS